LNEAMAEGLVRRTGRSRYEAVTHRARERRAQREHARELP
jgi:hypothetical protein